MKITWIVPHFPPHIGGGERLYMDVCLFLKEKGIDIRVVTSSSGGVRGHHNVDGLDVYYCDWPLVFGHPMVRMKDILPHVQWCDIVHTAIYSTAVKSNLAAFLKRKRCVTTVHEVMGKKWFWFEQNPLKATAFFMYERLIMMCSPVVHAVSKATAADYRTYGGRGKLFQIYNFPELPPYTEIEKEDISFRQYFSLKEGERGFLFFGRPAKNKGIFVLLKAMELISPEEAEHAGVRFCFILSPHPDKEYADAMKLIRESRLSEYVTVKPPLPRGELLKVLSGADCCVIPSITEGFGYAAAEACALKRNVISSDAGSLKEVVGGSCLFFRNRDERDLSDKIRAFMINGEDAFERVSEKHFDKGRIIEDYMKMYEKLIGNESG